MEKEHAVYERLERIDGLRREDAPADVLLDEVRALLAEAEDWIRSDADAPSGASEALARSQTALDAGASLPVG